MLVLLRWQSSPVEVTHPLAVEQLPIGQLRASEAPPVRADLVRNDFHRAAPSLEELMAQRAELEMGVKKLTAGSTIYHTTGPLIAMGLSAAAFSSMVLASSTLGPKQARFFSA